jgi:hypothetical protein
VSHKTIQGVLHPDGTVSLTGGGLPDHPVPVMITLLEQDEESSLAELGDYLPDLVDYEERLARGDIQWQ